MNYTIVGKNIEITDGMRDYAIKKLSRIEVFADNYDNSTIRVVVKVHPHEQKVEISAPVDGKTVRAEESSDDFYESIDLAIDKLEDQIRRNKTRKLKKKKYDKRHKMDMYDDYDFYD